MNSISCDYLSCVFSYLFLNERVALPQVSRHFKECEELYRGRILSILKEHPYAEAIVEGMQGESATHQLRALASVLDKVKEVADQGFSGATFLSFSDLRRPAVSRGFKPADWMKQLEQIQWVWVKCVQQAQIAENQEEYEQMVLPLLDFFLDEEVGPSIALAAAQKGRIEVFRAVFYRLHFLLTEQELSHLKRTLFINAASPEVRRLIGEWSQSVGTAGANDFYFSYYPGTVLNRLKQHPYARAILKGVEKRSVSRQFKFLNKILDKHAEQKKHNQNNFSYLDFTSPVTERGINVDDWMKQLERMEGWWIECARTARLPPDQQLSLVYRAQRNREEGLGSNESAFRQLALHHLVRKEFKKVQDILSQHSVKGLLFVCVDECIRRRDEDYFRFAKGLLEHASQSDIYTSFALAATAGHENMMRWLLPRVDFDSKPPSCGSAAIWAARHGFLEMFQELFSKYCALVDARARASVEEEVLRLAAPNIRSQIARWLERLAVDLRPVEVHVEEVDEDLPNIADAPPGPEGVLHRILHLLRQ